MANRLNQIFSSVEEALRDFPSTLGVGSFGPVVFSVSEERVYLINDVTREVAARVEEHKVTGGKPRLEFLAPELNESKFNIFLNANFGVSPLMELERLEEMCHEGRPARLILGGRNLGRNLLLKISEEWRRSLADGRVIIAAAGVTFKEYL